jgi:hypothetical protein
MPSRNTQPVIASRLQPVWQRLCGEEGFLELDAVGREDGVSLAGEVGIDSARERQLSLLQGEPAFLRVVCTALQVLDLTVAFRRGTSGRQNASSCCE